VVEPALDGRWALILGASSGFGAATARRLAAEGMHIAGVHLDRRSTMENVAEIVAAIEAHGRRAVFYNINAADEAKRREVLDDLQANVEESGQSGVRILMHSLAFGTLGPFVDTENPKRAISQRQMEMTLDVMANSLVYWVQDLLAHEMLGTGAKIYGMTSAGDIRVIPSYGAVSGAKAVLGSHIRQLAAELAPLGIAANAIKAGVTPTPALDKIPAAAKLMAFAQEHNPSGRVTRPEDVASAIVRLSIDDSHWLTGNTINVDGAEDIVVV
jgi:enoyl-[acyl-carrier protein] reductase III